MGPKHRQKCRILQPSCIELPITKVATAVILGIRLHCIPIRQSTTTLRVFASPKPKRGIVVHKEAADV